MASRRKQEENHLKILKDLLAQPCNKKCLECDQRGPTYVDVTIGSFVCTSCGGILRGLNPPHRVKSISMTTFTPAEISFIESRGNEWCRAVYLAKYDEQSRAKPESKSDHSKLKHFMVLKYEQKRWYESPTQQRKLMESAAAAAKKNKEEPNKTPPIKPLNSLFGESISNVPMPAKQELPQGNKASANLLESLSPPRSAPLTTQKKSENPSGFADFDSAFGGFSSPATLEPNSFAAFQVSSNPIPFTNSNAAASKLPNIGNEMPTTESNRGDKYAALVDLDLAFNAPQTTEKNDFWSPSGMDAQSTSNLKMTNSVFGNANQSQQSSVFPSPLIAPANAAPSNIWQSTPQTWNSMYQEKPVVNPAASATSNPFFSVSGTATVSAPPGSTASEYGAWTQPQRPVPNLATNPMQMSSTNPFNITPSTNQANYFQQTQSVKTLSNPTNPFMF